MYHTFYHLHTEPFRLTPDPAFSFRHERYAKALAYMQYALRQGEGFIMVTGMPGTGKTTLVEQFHSELNSARTLIAKLTSTQLQADELLRMICLSLGVVIEAQDKAGVLHKLREFLIHHAKQGKRILLLIDEAQDLPEHTLEELRLLGNLQLNGRPLLQIFLVGQQHLLDMVEQPAMQPLYQRLVAACHLEPLNLDETRAYIEYRLHRAGWNGDPAFDELSYRMIHRFSEGFPRQINKVCSRLMLYGSIEKKHKIDGFDCLKVLGELLEELPNSTHESSFQACVDLLNESCSVAAESDKVVDVPVDTAPVLAVQQPPSSADVHIAQLVTAEPEAAQAVPDSAHGAANRMQSVSVPLVTESVPLIIERWDAAAAEARSLPAGFTQPGKAAASSGAGLQSAVPVTVVRTRPTQRPRHPMRKPELLHNRTIRRVSAPLGLVVAVLAALFLASRGSDSVGSGDLATPSEAPEPAGTVARIAPASTVAPSAAAPAQEPASPDDSIEAVTPASPQGLVEVSPSRDASQTAESAVELPGSSGDSVATAALADDLFGPNLQRGMQEALPEASEGQPVVPASMPQKASAETVATSASPAQRTQLAAAAPAAPGSAVAVTQSGTASAAGLHGSTTTEGQAFASTSLAGFEVAVLTPPTETRAAADPQTVQASAEQLRIAELMASAEQALRENRLTIPQGSSAWDYYRQVLEIEPQHQGAGAGIQRIAIHYALRIERALAADQIDKAKTYVTRGLNVSPGNRKLLALKQDVTARESWLEAQASQAAAEAEAEALRRQAPPPEKEKPPPRLLDRLKTFFSNPTPREVP
jgi:type II secretory pathway predicted ATPase ExeA